jgi:hypothetical protein
MKKKMIQWNVDGNAMRRVVQIQQQMRRKGDILRHKKMAGNLRNGYINESQIRMGSDITCTYDNTTSHHTTPHQHTTGQQVHHTKSHHTSQ